LIGVRVSSTRFGETEAVADGRDRKLNSYFKKSKDSIIRYMTVVLNTERGYDSKDMTRD